MGGPGLNTTDPDAVSIHGTNPQNLVEKILRMRIYDHVYWKEHCFALSADALVDKAIELQYVGGTYGGNRVPTPFICLLLKMLQIQPEKEIVVELIKNEEYKYVRALGVIYMRLVGKSLDIYQYLEPLYNDYRKLRYRSYEGYEITHMDEFVDKCLRDESFCDISLPKLPRRHLLEDNGTIAKRISVLDDEVEDMMAAAEAEEEEDLLAAPKKEEKAKDSAAAAEARLDAAKAAQAPAKAAPGMTMSADGKMKPDDARGDGSDHRRSRSRSRGRDRRDDRRRSRSRSRGRRSRSRSRSRDRKKRWRSRSRSSSRSRSRSRDRRRRRSRSRSRGRRDDKGPRGAPPARGQGRGGIEPAWMTAKRKAGGEEEKEVDDGWKVADGRGGEKKPKKMWTSKGITKTKHKGGGEKKSKKEKKEKSSKREKDPLGGPAGRSSQSVAADAAGGGAGTEGAGAGESLEVAEANALRAKLGLKPLRA